ncbi:MAG TPA: hypothetical protein VFY73_25440 [Ideonella sp.]|uniref:TubC N-terminal docking domain-related protein n=1 Tax=Ideonella sp. TaxID=1929293 RepID=UPI002E2F16BB|nr:hypothetical protein [Ideonella sp.]HEX5687374.1 hypothetical protein [Ideonella sp.]
MGARELLCELSAVGLSVAAEGGRLVVRPASKLTDDMRAALREAKPAILALLAPAPRGPYALSRDEADKVHAQPWDDATCARFVARVTLFLRRGLTASDADDLAERLVLRDREGDDRRMCLECSNLTEQGRCLAAWRRALPGADRRLEPVQTILQRCECFHQKGGM